MELDNQQHVTGSPRLEECEKANVPKKPVLYEDGTSSWLWTHLENMAPAMLVGVHFS